jgi:hypothetical protein
VEWFWTSGFKDDAEFTNLILNKDSKCLNAAANRLRQQHSVCLLIDGTLLDHGFATMSELSKQVSGMPNHWVVLTSPAIVKQNRITLTLYSWGNIRPVHMPVAHFCRKFFGYVSGRA